MPFSTLVQQHQPVKGGAVTSTGGSSAGPNLESIAAKTAAYSVLLSDWGKTFTTRGATAAVTFTLPAVTSAVAGIWYRFYNVSAYGMVIASNGSSDNIVGKNDAAADSLTFTTTSLMIGACVKVIWDGTGWLSLIESDGNTCAVA